MCVCVCRREKSKYKKKLFFFWMVTNKKKDESATEIPLPSLPLFSEKVEELVVSLVEFLEHISVHPWQEETTLTSVNMWELVSPWYADFIHVDDRVVVALLQVSLSPRFLLPPLNTTSFKKKKKIKGIHVHGHSLLDTSYTIKNGHMAQRSFGETYT